MYDGKEILIKEHPLIVKEMDRQVMNQLKKEYEDSPTYNKLNTEIRKIGEDIKKIGLQKKENSEMYDKLQIKYDKLNQEGGDLSKIKLKLSVLNQLKKENEKKIEKLITEMKEKEQQQERLRDSIYENWEKKRDFSFMIKGGDDSYSINEDFSIFDKPRWSTNISNKREIQYKDNRIRGFRERKNILTDSEKNKVNTAFKSGLQENPKKFLSFPGDIMTVDEILTDVERVLRRLSSGVPLMKPRYNISSRSIVPINKKSTTTTTSLTTTTTTSLSSKKQEIRARGRGRSRGKGKGRGKR